MDSGSSLSSASEGCMADMWSLGVVTFYLLGGYRPFDDPDKEQLFRKIVAGKITFDDDKYWKHISADAKNFIAMLITVIPKDRLTAQEALLHPWLSLDDGGTDYQLSDKLAELQDLSGQKTANRRIQEQSLVTFSDLFGLRRRVSRAPTIIVKKPY